MRNIEREGDGFTVDGAFRSKYLVGAAGTRCPVYRTIFREANPRARELQAATYEHEFPHRWHDERCHLWFFEKGLPGYAWYVPKADGYLNCGIGGMAEKLKARGEDIKRHWRHFLGVLARRGLVRDVELAPMGYSYYLRGGVEVVRVGNAFIAGDSAGLATRDLCEGIGPAVSSGHRAAASIVEGTEYRLDDLAPYSSDIGSCSGCWRERSRGAGSARRGLAWRGRRRTRESRPRASSGHVAPNILPDNLNRSK